MSTDVNSSDLPPRVTSFLSRHGVTRGHRFRLEETIVGPDDRLFAAGTVSENPGIELRSNGRNGQSSSAFDSSNSRPNDARKTRQESDELAAEQEVIRLDGGSMPSSSHEMTQQERIAAALSRAGITKPEALMAAGISPESTLKLDAEDTQAATKPAERTNAAEPSDDAKDFDLKPALVMMKAAADAPFFLSYRSQKEVFNRVNVNSAAMLCGGAALSILGVVMFVFQR
jgi:hypothetical protein